MNEIINDVMYVFQLLHIKWGEVGKIKLTWVSPRLILFTILFMYYFSINTESHLLYWTTFMLIKILEFDSRGILSFLSLIWWQSNCLDQCWLSSVENRENLGNFNCKREFCELCSLSNNAHLVRGTL